MQREDAGADAVVGEDGGAVERSSHGRFALSAQGFLLQVQNCNAARTGILL